VFHRLTLLVALAAAVSLLGADPTAARVPQRIISLSPTATESLFAIGAGRQVVAVDDQSDYPKRAPRTSLSGYTPNLEAIAGYRPHLVVLAGDANDVVAGLRRLGIRVLLQPPAKDLAGAYAQIRQLGTITGHRKGAAALVTRMKRSIAQVLRSTPRR
jgi:iron complex transport system substrate-binding protein